jgi:hypothetical protein
VERDLITYFPGYRIRLRLEIEHVYNFIHVTASFIECSEIEGVVPRRTTVTTQNLVVQEARPDGVKTSAALFEVMADDRSRVFTPGNVYKLERLVGRTFKNTEAALDAGDCQGLSFRCAADFACDAFYELRLWRVLGRSRNTGVRGILLVVEKGKTRRRKEEDSDAPLHDAVRLHLRSLGDTHRQPGGQERRRARTARGPGWAADRLVPEFRRV